MKLLVFMFHRILPTLHHDAIDVATFRREIEYLKENFTILTPAECREFILGINNEKFKRGKKFAAVTFDDGWLDNYFYATPVLREAGVQAMIAISASRLHDTPKRHESDCFDYIARPTEIVESVDLQDALCNYCSREELADMVDSGVWHIVAHGTDHMPGKLGHSLLSHPQNGENTAQFAEFVRNDLSNCRKSLAELPGVIDDIFFWPWGHYSNLSSKIASECGYKIQFTVQKGNINFGDRRDVLPRIGVSSNWKKFRKNCFEFGNTFFSAVHDLFSKSKVCFDAK